MNSSVNELLGQIREKMDLSEEAWGPESGQEIDPGTHLASKAGDGGATNITNISDSFDMFVMDIVESLMRLFTMSETQALASIEHVSSQMAADGFIPPMPSDEASDDELARWAGSAFTAGLQAAVIQFCRDHAS